MPEAWDLEGCATALSCPLAASHDLGGPQIPRNGARLARECQTGFDSGQLLEVSTVSQERAPGVRCFYWCGCACCPRAYCIASACRQSISRGKAAVSSTSGVAADLEHAFQVPLCFDCLPLHPCVTQALRHLRQLLWVCADRLPAHGSRCRCLRCS